LLFPLHWKAPKLLLISTQILMRLSFQIALESSLNCSSSPRAFSSHSSRDCVYYSWSLLLTRKNVARELANLCGSPGRFVITSIS
jgi:hypothetical protein